MVSLIINFLDKTHMLKRIATAFLAFPLGLQLFFGGLSIQLARAEELAVPETMTETETETKEPYLIISAVQITGGTGKTQEDYIELFNPTEQPFDLNSYRLVKRTAAGTTDTLLVSWTQSTIVPPHHFWLWANSGFTTITMAPDSVSSGTLADNNGIALRKGVSDSGEIIDSLTWGSTANGFEITGLENPPANQALAKLDLFDLESGFELKASNPRNSMVEVLPEQSEQEPKQEPNEELPVENDPPEAESDNEDQEAAEINIEIMELLPNPTGTDTGAEKIELFNAGENRVNLEGMIIDDVAPSDSLSTNAYTIQNLEIDPGEYLALTIPAGNFSMNNTVGDVVTIFDGNSLALDSVVYSGTTPEAKSYTKFSDQWVWTNPTFGQDNGSLPKEDDEQESEEEETEDLGDYDNSGLRISELYPNPTPGDKEFIELYNSSETETAQLSVVVLKIGEKQKFLPAEELAPGKYFVIEQSIFPAQLRNTGQVVKILEDNTVLDEVLYMTAIKEAAYARFEDGFLWTTSVTKGNDNILNLPEETKKAEPAPKGTTVKKAAAKTKTTTKAPTKTTTKPAVKSTMVSAQSSKNFNGQQENSNNSTLESNAPAKSKEPIVKVIAMGAAAAAAGVVALYKLVFSSGE